MKKSTTALIKYFPVILVSAQVLMNLLYFIDKDLYLSNGFYLGWAFGTNAFFAFIMLVITFKFKFCSVSRWAAIAECIFALWYVVFQRDDIYNIIMQITIGSLAILVTLLSIYKTYPLCKFSLFVEFWRSFWAKKGDCDRALDRWDNVVMDELNKNSKIGSS